MRNRWQRALVLALLLVAAASRALDAQWLEVRPNLVLDGAPTAGVRITSNASRERDLIGPLPRSWHLASFVDAPLLLAAERNPETLRARLDGGLLLSLFRPSIPVGGVPSPDDPEPWNYGFIAVQASLGIETSQRANDADLSIGGSIEYGHDRYQRLWFVPEGRIGWDFVGCSGCAEGSAERVSGSRGHAEIGWSIPADREWMPGALRPLWLRLSGRGFVSSGFGDAVPVRNEDGLWGSAELAYRCDACGPVHELYVRAQAGRVPVSLPEEQAVLIGVALAF